MIQLHYAPNTAAMAPPILLEELGIAYDKWLAWLTNTLQAALIVYFYPERCMAEGHTEGVAELKAHAETRIGILLDQLDTELARLSATHAQPWLLGASYSAVDIYAMMLCRWTRNFVSQPARAGRTWAPQLQRVLARPQLSEPSRLKRWSSPGSDRTSQSALEVQRVVNRRTACRVVKNAPDIRTGGGSLLKPRCQTVQYRRLVGRVVNTGRAMQPQVGDTAVAAGPAQHQAAAVGRWRLHIYKIRRRIDGSCCVLQVKQHRVSQHAARVPALQRCISRRREPARMAGFQHDGAAVTLAQRAKK